MPVEFLSDDQAAAYGRFSGPPDRGDLERFFFLDDADRVLIARRRGDQNRLGFALQLGTVRFLGMFLADPLDVPAAVVDYLAVQLELPDASCVKRYAERPATQWPPAPWRVAAPARPSARGRTDLSESRPGMDDGFELRGAPGKGEGVFATRSFRTGETVMVGVIDRELDRNDAHASQISADRFVLHGGLIAKVNHSCDPNCGIRLNPSGAHDYVARRPIAAGLEITFDYAMRNYSIEHFAAHCLCGSARCRDRITGWKDLPAQRKADYRGCVAPYLTDLDDQHATDTAEQQPAGS